MLRKLQLRLHRTIELLHRALGEVFGVDILVEGPGKLIEIDLRLTLLMPDRMHLGVVCQTVEGVRLLFECRHPSDTRPRQGFRQSNWQSSRGHELITWQQSAGGAIDGFTHQVGMPAVAGILRQQMYDYPPD